MPAEDPTASSEGVQRQSEAGSEDRSNGSGHTTTGATTAEAKDLGRVEEIEQLEFSVDRSRRYHSRRQAFFDLCHKTVMVTVLLGGSGAFIQLASNGKIFAQILTAIVALAGIADLIFAFSHRARDHEMLYRRFSQLANDIAITASPTEQNYRQWVSRRLEIEADEPPIYCALDVSCHNQVVQAWGVKAEKASPLGFWQRALMHLVRFSGTSFPNYEELGVSPPKRVG